MTRFELATPRPPDAYSNRTELHPELLFRGGTMVPFFEKRCKITALILIVQTFFVFFHFLRHISFEIGCLHRLGQRFLGYKKRVATLGRHLVDFKMLSINTPSLAGVLWLVLPFSLPQRVLARGLRGSWRRSLLRVWAGGWLALGCAVLLRCQRRLPRGVR